MTLRTIALSFLLIAALGTPAIAEPDVTGLWGTKYGEMAVEQRGAEVSGVLVKTSKYCPFKNGEKILSGAIMEDSLAGAFKMCQADDECGGPVWAHAVFLIADNSSLLTGSAHSKKAVCPLVGFSKSSSGDRGLYFKRLRKSESKPKIPAKKVEQKAEQKPETTREKKIEAVAKAEMKENKDEKKKAAHTIEDFVPLPESMPLPGPPAPPGTYDPRSVLKVTTMEENNLLDGKRMINLGRFEMARREFEKVLEKDPGNPTALVGIGVTYYARNDYEMALSFYKRALSSDPGFGMAYYNMGSIYALQNKPEMAIRYLKIAFMNGFVVLKEMQEDPDLNSLRELPEYKKLIQGEF